MKTSKKIAASFGLTHQEMAELLNVGRAHWTMYESNTRSLPTDRVVLLTEMRSHMDAVNTGKRADLSKENQKKMRLHLEKLLRENEFEQLSLARKIDELEQKIAIDERRLQLVAFLSSGKVKERLAASPRLIPSATRTFKTPQRDSITLSVEYELRKETLDFEKGWLERKIKALK